MNLGFGSAYKFLIRSVLNDKQLFLYLASSSPQHFQLQSAVAIWLISACFSRGLNIMEVFQAWQPTGVQLVKGQYSLSELLV